MSQIPTMQDPAWYDVITRFRAKASEFMTAVSSLQGMLARDDVPDSLRAEGNTILQRAAGVKSTVQNITGWLDSVGNFWNRLFDGIDGYAQGRGLGAVPFIPIAVVVGAVTAMTAIISDVYQFERKLTEARRLQAAGVSPAEAARLAQGYGGAGLLDGAKALAWTAALIGAVVLVGPMVGKMIGKRIK